MENLNVLLFEEFMNSNDYDDIDNIHDTEDIQDKNNELAVELDGKSYNINLDSIEIDGIDIRDYPDFVDAYVSYAETTDGTELSEDELNRFTEENSDIIHELIYDKHLY